MIDEVFSEAQTAALSHFHQCTPVPVIFGQAKDLFSSEIIPGTEEYVSDGVCGFAWVNIKPARGPLVKYLKSKGIGRPGTYGGYSLSSYNCIPGSGSSQSMQRKEAGCRAFVEVVKKYFPDMKIWVETRID